MYFEIDGRQFKESEHRSLKQHLQSTSTRYDDWRMQLMVFLTAWYGEEASISVRTSGSTGTPVKITHSKESMRKSARKTADYFGFKDGHTALLCLPTKFIAGQMMIVRALTSNMNLVCVEPSSDPLDALNQQINFAAMTPHQLFTSIKIDSSKPDLIDVILLGGGPISPDQEKAFCKLRCACLHSYGMTETISHVALRRVNGAGASKCFHALPGVVFSQDDNGCLIIDADHLDRPVVYTNDVVKMIDTQSFQWLGRKDHVVNSGGIKLHPEILEEKISGIISHAYFFTGAPDKVLGQKLVLFINSQPYTGSDLFELKEKLRKRLKPVETPKNIYFVPHLEKTATGKVKKSWHLYEKYST